MMRTLFLSAVLAVQFMSTDLRAAGPVEAVIGQKLDSGLGGLPPYAEWYRHPHLSRLVPTQNTTVSGEKRDSGLGELPLFADWGRYPELKHLAASAGPLAGTTGTDEQRDRMTAYRR